jgi:hypothetical protein
MAQVVDRLPNKFDILNSYHNQERKKKISLSPDSKDPCFLYQLSVFQHNLVPSIWRIKVEDGKKKKKRYPRWFSLRLWHL